MVEKKPDKNQERKDPDEQMPDPDEQIEQHVQEEADDKISKATEAAERMEEANKVMAKNLDRQEAIQVEKILGGETEAGGKQQTEDEKADASARKLIAGSGLEDMAFPEKEKSKSI